MSSAFFFISLTTYTPIGINGRKIEFIHQKEIAIMERLESLLEWGGLKKDVFCLAVSAAALIFSLAGFSIGCADQAWIAIIMC